jgi:hypothetical protein
MMLPSRARTASWLLACVLPAQDVEHVVGDLEEELALRACEPHGGHGWYWSQLARSLPGLLWLTIRRGRWTATVAVALAACAVQAGIELGVGFGLYLVSSPGTRWAQALSATITLPALVFVNRQAARVRPGAAIAFATIAASVLVTRTALLAVAGRPVPVAMLAAIVVVPALALTGGILARLKPS